MSKTGTLLTAGLILSTALACLAEVPTQKKSPTSTHDLIRHLLDQDLGTRKFSFPDVILAGSGKKVIPSDTQTPAHKIILDTIGEAANLAVTELSTADSPIRKLRRINEASRFFENHVRKTISKHPSLSCTIPKNTQGHEQRSGYPDLLITHTDTDGTTTHAYLDPKLYEEKSRASSFRTFYFEPRTRTNKIQHDALHLLIGISHDGKEGAWTFTGWKICDLSKFHVRLKAEFQGSNRDLYRPDLIINSSKNQPKNRP